MKRLFKKLFALSLVAATGYIYYKLFTTKRPKIAKNIKRLVMAENHGLRIKDDGQYKELRKKGMSKEKISRIINSSKKKSGKKGGQASKYEDWTKDRLYEKARKVGIEGRSKMNKKELIKALLNY